MIRTDIAQYQCGVCQKVCQQTKHEPLYQCAVCFVFLCPDCDYDGVCEVHHKVLNPADQDMLATFAEEDQKIRSRSRIVYMIMWMLVGLAVMFLLIYILLAVAPYPIIDYSNLIVGIIFLVGAGISIYYRYQVSMQRETVRITVDGILMKYPELAAIMEGRSGTNGDEELEENLDTSASER